MVFSLAGMTVGIIGTRGIPNNYGGFEQFAEYLSRGLVELGHEVVVYSSHDHPYQEKIWNNVKLIHILNPEKRLGTWGQFIYDLFCIWDSRKRKFDLILQLGYTSNSIWGWLLPNRSLIVTNMDGLEWRRTKYNKRVQRFILHAEKLAVKTSDFLIADSIGIQSYLLKTYKRDSIYIPYGTDIFKEPNPNVLEAFNALPYGYNLLIARMEPENSIEIILDGVCSSHSAQPFLVVGNPNGNDFGRYLVRKYAHETRIRFLGAIYNLKILNNLRYYSNLYFHGHTVGGTNPSLLEAMASNSLICAHNNEFNNSILGNEAFYFSTKQEATTLIDSNIMKEIFSGYLQANLRKIETLYLWEKIIKDYEIAFQQYVNSGNKKQHAY